MKIYVIIQSNSSHSIGFSDIVRGITSEAKKEHIKTEFLYVSIEEIPQISYKNEIVLLLGFSEAFVTSSIIHLSALNNTVIVLHNRSPIYGGKINTVSIDREQVMLKCISYLQMCGKKNTAFLGYNKVSMSALHYESVFRKYFPPENLFENYDSVDRLCQRFLANYKKFDSVICFTDKFAILLINKAMEMGIKIPDELFVMGIGGTKISALTTPSVTTISPSYYKCGETGVSMINLINPSVSEPIHITLKSELFERESTANIKYDDECDKIVLPLKENATHASHDINFAGVNKLEKLFTAFDDVDKKIFQKLLENKTYEQISDEIPLGLSTIHYRMNKWFSISEIENKKELFELVNKYKIKIEL